MTSFESRRGPPRRSRAAKLLRILVVLLGAVLVFLLGVSFARTLDERPKPSGPETIVRTLTPLPQDAPPSTVTVTVTTP